MMDILQSLKDHRSLTAAQVTEVLEAIVNGRLSDEVIEEFLLLLRQKGETVEEISAAASVMNRYKIKLTANYTDALDTCGTGGDALYTINISTLSALIASSLGVRVAKHGNRSVSSLCGSADLLELLGVKIDVPIESAERSLMQINFAFFFAPLFHPAMRYAMPARRKIKGKTIFNLLGPLSNPANAKHQIIGVYRMDLVEKMALVLKEQGTKKALVVCGRDGMDELSICEKTLIGEVNGPNIKIYEFGPEDFGIEKIRSLEPIQCKNRDDGKKLALDLLTGHANKASEDIVCLNAAAALFAAEKTRSIREGIETARQALHSHQALNKLEEIILFTGGEGI